MKRKSGFTLLEILVVIAIMGVLSALLLPNFMDARSRARDTQRKNDLKQMQRALEMYKLDQNPQSYPASGTIPAPGLAFGSANGNYIKAVPKDPITSGAYEYDAIGAGPIYTNYTLCACLENVADTELVAGNCPGGLACTGGKSYQLTAP